MFGREDSRIAVLESQLSIFSDRITVHMEREEQSFKELRGVVDKVLLQMDDVMHKNADMNKVARVELSDAIQREYATRIELRDMLTGMRSSLEKSIEDEAGAIRREFKTMFVVISGIVTAIGWVYVNLLS